MEPRSSAAAVATLHCWPRWRIPQNYRRPHHSARSSQSPHRAPRPSHRAIAPPPPRCLLHRGRPWHRRRCPQNGVQMGWGKGGAFGDGKEGETAVAAGDNGEGGIANVQSCDMKDRFPPRAAATVYRLHRSTAMPCGIRSNLQLCHAESGCRCSPGLEMYRENGNGTGISYYPMRWTCNQIKCPIMRRKKWPGQPRSRPTCLQSAAKWKLEQPDVSESMHCLNHELASSSLIRSLPSTQFSYTLASAGMVLLLAFTTYQLGFPFGLKTVKMTSIILSKRILYVHDN
uniref:Uncharacterized protein n=1 Tax=Oryza meridionalis TaxID=40149 RepID=A0A0E0E1C5_9ORYZ